MPFASCCMHHFIFIKCHRLTRGLNIASLTNLHYHRLMNCYKTSVCPHGFWHFSRIFYACHLCFSYFVSFFFECCVVGCALTAVDCCLYSRVHLRSDWLVATSVSWNDVCCTSCTWIIRATDACCSRAISAVIYMKPLKKRVIASLLLKAVNSSILCSFVMKRRHDIHIYISTAINIFLQKPLHLDSNGCLMWPFLVISRIIVVVDNATELECHD